MQFSAHDSPTDTEEVTNEDLNKINEFIPFKQKSVLRRSVNKRGYCALQKRKRPPSFYIKYVKDPFTTLIDCRWRSLIVIYILSFLLSWFIFAVLWWSIAYVHGDIPGSNVTRTGLEPCVTEIEDLVTSFIFSMETQTSIGYGNRTPTTECPEAILLISVQSIFGILLQSVVVGIVFAKLSRPKTRGESVMFSKNAVISMRNDQRYLMFRLGDERKSNLTGCKILGWVIENKSTDEGLLLPNYVTKINVSVDNGGNHFFLLWPVIATHKIDSCSPLYGMNLEEMTRVKMEIIVSFVCTSEATGQEIEIRSSYTSHDILWGHRFKSILQVDNPDFVVDYQYFDCTEKVDDSETCVSSSLSSPYPHSSTVKVLE